MTTSDARFQSGFTLFEVLAAVLVLGLVFTVLADSAMEGLRAEGTNRRRGEASLLADRRLAELEARLSGPEPLLPGRTREEVPPYVVTVEVTPLDLLGLLPPPDPDSVLAPPEDEEQALDSLLATTPTGESRVQQVTVTVEWEEVGVPHQVSRRTFAFDRTGLEELLPGEEDGAPDSPLSELEDQLGGEIPQELQDAIEGSR